MWVEIQLTHSGQSMGANLTMNDGSNDVQTLPVAKGPVLFAFSAPASKTAAFALGLSNDKSVSLWVESVKLLQVKQ